MSVHAGHPLLPCLNIKMIKKDEIEDIRIAETNVISQPRKSVILYSMIWYDMM